MLVLKSLDVIIAERNLICKNREDVIVRLGKPEIYPDGPDDYYCPYQILGLGDDRIKYGFGIDAFQALFHSLKFIATAIQVSAAYKANDLCWVSEENLDLGFFDFEQMRV